MQWNKPGAWTPSISRHPGFPSHDASIIFVPCQPASGCLQLLHPSYQWERAICFEGSILNSRRCTNEGSPTFYAAIMRMEHRMNFGPRCFNSPAQSYTDSGQALCAEKRKCVAAHRTKLLPSLLCSERGAQPRADFQLCVRNGCGNNMIGPWSGNAGSELPHPRATCAAETPHNRKPKKLGIWCSWHWLQQAYTGWKVRDDTSLTRPHLEAINEL